MKILEVDKITKRFGNFTAVDQISFSIDEGAVFGLLGPNGAGKTTTLRMIMNIIIPDSGTISILGNSNMMSATDSVGYLPEERGLYRKMKVDELLLFLAELKSMPKSSAKEQVDYWLTRFDLAEWKKKKVEELSKGMQQKLQFIGTVIHKPKLLILDEPFGGLDPINTNLIKDITLELKKSGTTVIFSTHVMESAEKICDEILLINKGKQVIYGRLNKVKSSFGKQNVIIEFEGSDSFLSDSRQVKKFNNYGNFAEIQLEKDADTQKLLSDAMAHCKIRKFEIKEPSLHDIFIDSINGSETEGVQNE